MNNISDKILKFHEQDRRILYQETWEKKLQEYGIT